MGHLRMAACGLGDIGVSLLENSWVTPDDMITKTPSLSLDRDVHGYSTFF